MPPASPNPPLAPPGAPADTAPRPVALVTGGARRIGRAIVLELAANGFDIALHCRDAAAAADAAATAAQAQALGARAEIFAADFATVAACRALVPAVVARMGRLDALVNNASRFEDDRPGAFDPALLHEMLQANTIAPVLLAEGLAAQLGRQPARTAAGAGALTPCVVNLLDQKLANPNPDHFSYTLTKAALQHATLTLAQAFAPVLRVCGVSPGLTLHSGPMNDAEFAAAQAMTPLGRSSTPQDIARSVRFLIESPAITGIDLCVDGGQHLRPQPRDVLFLARAAIAGAA